MRQGLNLILKVKTFKIFTAICKRPILTYHIGKTALGSFPLKVFKNRT
jgi:hypothetical protein